MRWAIGAVVAVLSAMVVLPGVASAHHPQLEDEIFCNDGTFEISADYFGGQQDKHMDVVIEGSQMTTPNNPNNNVPNNLPAGTSAHITDNNGSFNWVDDQDEWQINSDNGENNFFVLAGDYDAVDARPDDRITVQARMFEETGGGASGAGTPTQSEWNNRGSLQDTDTESVSTDDFWDDCGIDVCVDGDQGVDALSFRNPETGDCDPIRVCVDGQNFLVTEFEQQESGLATGDCIPYEPPPVPPTPPTITTPPAPVQQVAAAVSEVLPARLPSTGMGPGENSSSFSWAAAVTATLLALGGMTALVARRKES